MAAAAEYSFRTQAKIPGVIAVLHNFVHTHDPDDFADGDEDGDNMDSDSDHGENGYEIPITPENLGGHISQAERDRASAKRDKIAKAMWEDDVEELLIRSLV